MKGYRDDEIGWSSCFRADNGSDAVSVGWWRGSSQILPRAFSEALFTHLVVIRLRNVQEAGNR